MGSQTTDVLLARFFENAEAAAEMLELARAEPVVEGHAGQPKANPLFSVAQACAETARGLHGELRRSGAVVAPGPAPSEHLDEPDPIEAIARRRAAWQAAGGNGSDAA